MSLNCQFRLLLAILIFALSATTTREQDDVVFDEFDQVAEDEPDRDELRDVPMTKSHEKQRYHYLNITRMAYRYLTPEEEEGKKSTKTKKVP